MKPPERELSKEEYDAWKAGNREVRHRIRRGHPKMRENHALDEKLRIRAKKAKKRAYKERRKERKQKEALRLGQKTPMIASDNREVYAAP